MKNLPYIDPNVPTKGDAKMYDGNELNAAGLEKLADTIVSTAKHMDAYLFGRK